MTGYKRKNPGRLVPNEAIIDLVLGIFAVLDGIGQRQRSLQSTKPLPFNLVIAKFTVVSKLLGRLGKDRKFTGRVYFPVARDIFMVLTELLLFMNDSVDYSAMWESEKIDLKQALESSKTVAETLSSDNNPASSAGPSSPMDMDQADRELVVPTSDPELLGVFSSNMESSPPTYEQPPSPISELRNFLIRAGLKEAMTEQRIAQMSEEVVDYYSPVQQLHECLSELALKIDSMRLEDAYYGLSEYFTSAAVELMRHYQRLNADFVDEPLSYWMRHVCEIKCGRDIPQRLYAIQPQQWTVRPDTETSREYVFRYDGVLDASAAKAAFDVALDALHPCAPNAIRLYHATYAAGGDSICRRVNINQGKLYLDFAPTAFYVTDNKDMAYELAFRRHGTNGPSVVTFEIESANYRQLRLREFATVADWKQHVVYCRRGDDDMVPPEFFSELAANVDVVCGSVLDRPGDVRRQPLEDAIKQAQRKQPTEFYTQQAFLSSSAAAARLLNISHRYVVHLIRNPSQ